MSDYGHKAKTKMSRHSTHHYRHQRKKALKTSRKKSVQGPIDYFVYFFMFVSPLFEVPQALNIYTQKSAHTVSLTTWALFFMASLAWLIYGLRNHLRLIIAVHVVYMTIEALVVIGILRYS